jgi:hypothetical protein
MLRYRYPQDVRSILNLQVDSRVVIRGFKLREGAAERWTDDLTKMYRVIKVGVGGEVVRKSPRKSEPFEDFEIQPPATGVEMTEAKSDLWMTLSEAGRGVIKGVG